MSDIRLVTKKTSVYNIVELLFLINITLVTQTNFLVNEKGDVEMAKCFSIK